MTEMTLVGPDQCTACGACAANCPKKCIQMVQDELGCYYPKIQNDKCVQCGLCRKTCPAITPPEKLPKGTVYAAWNADDEQRKNAASGGIATAIYEHALIKGYKTFGVCSLPEGTAEYIEIKTREDIERCRNSKYVYTDIGRILMSVKRYIKDGKTVILPALPCQAAAVLNYLGDRSDNLILVDIVCHGVCPDTYLKQHVACIEKKRKKRADALFFRDPRYATNQFVFSLYQNEKPFYHAKVHANDVYQLGYHKALSYRENCYHCAYATKQRLGDMTVSDFSGLGRLAPFEYPRDSVSCMIVSSEKGEKLLSALISENRILCHQRPSGEAFDYEKQLRAPSVPHAGRQVFIQHYLNSGDYVSSARRALKRDIAKNNIVNGLHIPLIKKRLSGILPKNIKKWIRNVIK
ncbi:MAG: Coenzyme F420 hydrogenase/dehydrogenase, beta subunit C-terminal domain [Oscillospiraceae bacterium]|nr:Coenzyme F420 hydrogenase/dehydrogenase, beta subunit C-terminal domain [Oscillospiraceae bacterium]